MTSSTGFRVVGIDPGTRLAGYGIVDVHHRGIDAVACGAWDLGAAADLFVRLGKLSRELERLFVHYSPTHICLEEAFVSRNIRSAMLLGHARGIAMARAHEFGMVFQGMSASHAKKRVTGNGAAKKEKVAQSVLLLLGIDPGKKLPLDATDALGLSYACALDLQIVLRTTQRSSQPSPMRDMVAS